MNTVVVSSSLTMLQVRGWQVYVWRDGGSVTVIDTGAPDSSAQILAAVPQIDRIVLTHGHADHCGSAAELQDSTDATVFAGAGDAAAIITGRPCRRRCSRIGKSPNNGSEFTIASIAIHHLHDIVHRAHDVGHG